MFKKVDNESKKESIEDLKETFDLNNKCTINWYEK